MAERTNMRQEVKDMPRAPGTPARTAIRGEGARWLVEDLAGGLIRVTIDRGAGGTVVHTGTADEVRVRLAADADARDAAAIDAALPAKA